MHDTNFQQTYAMEETTYLCLHLSSKFNFKNDPYLYIQKTNIQLEEQRFFFNQLQLYMHLSMKMF